MGFGCCDNLRLHLKVKYAILILNASLAVRNVCVPRPTFDKASDFLWLVDGAREMWPALCHASCFMIEESTTHEIASHIAVSAPSCRVPHHARAAAAPASHFCNVFRKIRKIKSSYSLVLLEVARQSAAQQALPAADEPPSPPSPARSMPKLQSTRSMRSARSGHSRGSGDRLIA